MDAPSLEHFWTHGWVRIAGAFSEALARRMRDTVWDALAAANIARDQPETWTVERPTNLQRLKDDPIFQAIGSARLKAALDAIFDRRAFDMPKHWGEFFLAFPTSEEWHVPTAGWHVDAHYGSALRPTPGVKTHALLDKVAPRGVGA